MMKKKLVIWSLLILVLWSAKLQAETGEDAVKTMLNAYEDAWSRHDGDAVASFYFEPAMRLSKSGPVVRATQAEQRAFFQGFLRGLVERGYARSAWEELDIRLLDSQTALASGITVRYRSDGTVLERVAVTYGLWNSENGWKIFLSATHSPDGVVRFR
jgi:ketosteroid isomerase-like protein